jgi:two-component system OmpR family sensor kinase
MTKTADAITAGQLDQRIDPPTPGTEAAHLARALNSMLDQRQRTEEQLRQFVGDASHELRTPLTSIRGYAELYQRGGLPTPEGVEDAMRRIRYESIRMEHLVDELLLLAQLDQARPLAAEPVDVGQLVRDAASDASAASPDRTITVNTTAPLVIVGDEHKLRQVLAALVTNSLRHTTSEVSLRGIAGSGGQVVIEVDDNGPGMAPDVASRAFERFYRGDPSRQRGSGGTGLGLAIVDSIVRAHGGTIELQTDPKTGTRVRVVLPGVPPNGRAPRARDCPAAASHRFFSCSSSPGRAGWSTR